MARAARDGVQATSGTKPRGRARTRDHVVAHIDIDPLLTGVARPGERCEIPGVGPVPVEHVRSLLGDAVPVSEGGDSTAENTDALCRQQHHRRKSRGWRPVDHLGTGRTRAES